MARRKGPRRELEEPGLRVSDIGDPKVHPPIVQHFHTCHIACPSPFLLAFRQVTVQSHGGAVRVERPPCYFWNLRDHCDAQAVPVCDSERDDGRLFPSRGEPLLAYGGGGRTSREPEGIDLLRAGLQHRDAEDDEELAGRVQRDEGESVAEKDPSGESCWALARWAA